MKKTFEILRSEITFLMDLYIDLCQHANKYKQVVLETVSGTFNGIRRVTYVIWAVK